MPKSVTQIHDNDTLKANLRAHPMTKHSLTRGQSAHPMQKTENITSALLPV